MNQDRFASDRALTRRCLELALEAGAAKARVSLSVNIMDLVATLDGAVDRVSHCADRALSLGLFVDGRYGCFSTNKLEENALRDFTQRSVRMVRMLQADECRDLPDPMRTAKDARSGDEPGICDPACADMTAQARKELALHAAAWGAAAPDGSWRLVSEEGEYSDSYYEQYIVDSNGLECRHRETSFEYGVEVTVEDRAGNKYSGYWWESAPMLRDFHPDGCGKEAVRQAVASIGPKALRSGKYRTVIDTEVAAKVVSPILRALGGYAIQQDNSFLRDAVGKQLFPKGMTLTDRPRIPGQTGSKYFDSEGVASADRDIIRDGVVQCYLLNTHMAAKLGLSPTLEEAIRPVLASCWPGTVPPRQPGRTEMLQLCGEGILVTEFNGGNSNSATGDFSYGVEGFYFKDGQIVHPVSGMVMTGNFLQLWGRLIAIADDARICHQKLIPTLAFDGVDFSGS